MSDLNFRFGLIVGTALFVLFVALVAGLLLLPNTWGWVLLGIPTAFAVWFLCVIAACVASEGL